ncbi:unnamed protein product [Polarella glacialis]|uniref:SSD domain-containing protein n=1 Tax=Polarella glacialis TaxID=89957 RepID=A0A813LVQ4_POLGL|nr:unnamed protein product [Polarella glacialis]CAE8739153.1 unnamed protein product [Polarella glacialis]
MSSIPVSFVVAMALTGSADTSIASFLAVFLVIGLGSDVVFVYTDFWRDSKEVKVSRASRMTWTLLHAGKASFATSSTTAISFFANLASVLKPLREFGFFMGLCVVTVWVLLTLMFVPLCLVDEIYFSRCKIDVKRLCMPRTSMDEDQHSSRVRRMVSFLFRWRRTGSSQYNKPLINNQDGTNNCCLLLFPLFCLLFCLSFSFGFGGAGAWQSYRLSCLS